MSDIFLFGRILECMARLIYFCIFFGMLNSILCLWRISISSNLTIRTFFILINPFTTNPGYWKICIEYIFTKNTTPLDRDVVEWFWCSSVWRKYISSDFYHYSSESVIPVLAGTSWNDLLKLCVAPKCQGENQLTHLSYTRSWLWCRSTNLSNIRIS